MQTFENLLSPKPLNKILRILNTNSLWVCVIKIYSNGIATYIICEMIVKYNLNIGNLMQILENLLLQNHSTQFLDLEHNFLVCGY